MATVTTQERTNILKLVAGMFNAAPGATYLNDFTNAFVATNKDYSALATALGESDIFKSLYPSSLSADEFANKFLDTLGLKANTEAQDWVKAKVNAGESFASVIFQALVAIDASTADEFKAARDQLANKAAVAEYYSVTLGKSADSLEALQGVVANVTDDPKSVEDANQANEGGNGETFTLTEALAQADTLPAGYKLSDATVALGELTVDGVAPAQAAAQAIVTGAANAADLTLAATYTLADTLANLQAADPAVLANAASYSLSETVFSAAALEGQSVAALTGAQAIARADKLAELLSNPVVNGATNATSVTVVNGAYTLADTLANLEAADPAVLAGAASYSLTETAFTAADVASDVAGLAAAQDAAEAAVLTNTVVAGAANAADVIVADGAYTLADTLANLQAADAAVLEGAASYSLINAAGNLGILIPGQKAIVDNAANVADYNYVWFTFEAAAGNTNLEGAGQTYTVTAVDKSGNPVVPPAGTKVEFAITPGNATAGDQGTNTTNLNDFAEGSFNPKTVTFADNATTSTFVVEGVSDDLTELPESYTVTATIVGFETAPLKVTNELLLDGAGVGGGKTYMLTKGLDNVPGTAGNDTIIGSIDNGNAELNTLSAQDIINGGAGTDTLKIAHNDNGTTAAAVTLGNLSNVEVVEVESAASQGMTVNTTTVTGVTNLNVTKAAGAVVATAGATTDVDVSLKDAAGIATVTVNGGKDVNVALTDAVSNIDVGATGTDPVGAVTITATSAAVANNANPAMGTISVGGGKTVNVTQKAGDASAIVADGTTETVAQGNVIVTAGATTTDVTVKQDAAVAPLSRAAVTGVTEVASVKFTKLDANDSVTISGLTFKASKDLTAEQVAQAFANLSASAIKPTDVTAPPAATATGDTNGGSASANGKFTGSLLADWTSGAATGDTVVFTGKANTAMTDLAPSAKATVTTTTQGVTAVSAQNTLGVTNGTVTIAGAAALKTVTVDGYAASTNTAGITGATNTALDTISLANGGNFEIDSAAAALGLTLANVNGTVTVTAGTKTLNAAVSHAKATDTAILVSASAETVNVSGTGTVSDNGTALAAATVINTSAMTAGKATFTVSGIKTTYTGGAGVDTVTVSDAGTPITKAIDLGAGDDTLTLNGAAVAPTATLKGGDGTDTIAMTGARAEALSANATFAGKIEGFEKLSITDKVAAAATVNMANMDGITYVVSNNTTNVAAGATKTTFTLDVGTSTATATDTVTFDGSLYVFTGAAASGAAFATQLYALISASAPTGGNWVATGLSGTKITFEAVTGGVKATPANTAFVFADADTSGSVAGFVTAEVTAGAAAGTSPALTIDKMANNGTLELVGAGDGVVVKMADATGSTDSFNIVTKVAGNLSFGTVDVAGVETLKLNAVDTTPGTAAAPTIDTASLTVKADKATSLTIEGSSNVTLTLDATTTKLATIDAGTLTGNLDAGNTLNAVAMTITGGKGADQLKASVGTDAKADVLNGGDGNDTLYAGSNGAKLSGGDGNDLFIVTANSATVGNKESNTYSEILDFKAGDLLQLQASNTAGNAAIDVTAFTKLAASLNETTAVFSDFVNAAIKEAGAGAATWFNYKGDAYVVIDSATDSTGDVFKNGEDLIVKLTGINGDNLSWNSDFATVALI